MGISPSAAKELLARATHETRRDVVDKAGQVLPRIEETADVLWRDDQVQLAKHVWADDRAPGFEDKPWLANAERFAPKRSGTMTVEYVYPKRVTYGRSKRRLLCRGPA
jgi:hypothetical protein